MAEEKKQALTPLKDIISALLGSGRPVFNAQEAMIRRAWDEVAWNTAAGNAQPLWIKDGRLRVSVSDSIRLQELYFMEETMRNKLNEKLGTNAVKKIEFRLRSR